MKKLRNEKPELSKKSPYYIPKRRYYELKNFCLQYPDWKKALEQINGWESNYHEVSGIIRGNLPESSTERQAIIRAYYSTHIILFCSMIKHQYARVYGTIHELEELQLVRTALRLA